MIRIYDQESFTKKFMSNLIVYSFSFRKKFKWKSSKHGILTVAIIRCDKRFFICSITSVNKWDVIGLKFAKFIPRSDYLFFAYNWQIVYDIELVFEANIQRVMYMYYIQDTQKTIVRTN